MADNLEINPRLPVDAHGDVADLIVGMRPADVAETLVNAVIQSSLNTGPQGEVLLWERLACLAAEANAAAWSFRRTRDIGERNRK